MRILTLYLLLMCFGCKTSKKYLIDVDTNSYSSKTYMFMGNSFEDYYDSKIDSTNFTWQDSFQNGLLVFREYPKYQGELRRTEEYKYYKNGDPEKTKISTFYPSGEVTDSTIYIKIDSNITEIYEYKYLENPYKEVHRTEGDTLYIDHITNGSLAFTTREYWETKSRKHSQIIEPELSDISNVFVYNDKGDLTKIERYEKDEFEITMSIEYEYDPEGRITKKVTYYGQGDERVIGHEQFTIYE